jgi:bifunctional non-homologous end joining protein LigD
MAARDQARRFRIIARKKGSQVRLYSRPGNDLTRRFPLIVETLARLRSRSCIVDGEAVACDDNGVASFDLVRHQRANDSVFLYAFDLIELIGDDLRRDPLKVRKATLASVLAKAGPGIRFNEHVEGDGPTVFAHACKMGLLYSILLPRQRHCGCIPQSLRWRMLVPRSGEAQAADRVSAPTRHWARDGPGLVRILHHRPTYELSCTHKSSKQTGNLPSGMWQAGNTARQCGSG